MRKWKLGLNSPFLFWCRESWPEEQKNEHFILKRENENALVIDRMNVDQSYSFFVFCTKLLYRIFSKRICSWFESIATNQNHSLNVLTEGGELQTGDKRMHHWLPVMGVGASLSPAQQNVACVVPLDRLSTLHLMCLVKLLSIVLLPTTCRPLLVHFRPVSQIRSQKQKLPEARSDMWHH